MRAVGDAMDFQVDCFHMWWSSVKINKFWRYVNIQIR